VWCAFVRTGAQQVETKNRQIPEFFSSLLSGPTGFGNGAPRSVRTGAQHVREG
jgi:hypothetical protein